MRYVIKDVDTGHYVKGESSWNRKRDADITKAKLFHRKADALAHIDRWKHWARAFRYTVVPVQISEVPA
ncbi:MULTISPECIES: hypothetical protein [unclassified Mesorhizobium]|uniref:hypothetical protein n=1 Tax=unclassified Mesorhizobium TaxID=325217 RepID=UPI000FCCB050|nr:MULTISPECIES: hypothetical protein [unclassified Mesorhizobium]RUT88032.1 hypothetical protein EOD14_08345 [Mesorhizobium sp. M7A.T.Ca.US.000.02.1.1]RUT90711.1 hypothetical protein EOD15_17720 [Mesorhizobium sp. M7A.T.Ca.US.000.02.2.1]